MINENLWYLAPMGYGVGTIVICIELLVIEKISKDSIMSIKSS